MSRTSGRDMVERRVVALIFHEAKKQGIIQSDLGRVIGKWQNHMSELKNGKNGRCLSIDQMMKLFNHLGINAGEVMWKLQQGVNLYEKPETIYIDGKAYKLERVEE